MNWRMCVGMAMVMAMASGRMYAQAPSREPAGKEGLTGEGAVMARELSLTDDQIARLKEAYQIAMSARKDWENQNKEKGEKLRADAEAAQQAGDQEALRKLREQFRTLQEERGKSETDLNKRIMEVLTPEQKATWVGLKTYRGEYAAMAKAVGLSTDQETQLKETVKTYAAALAKWDEEHAEKITKLEQQERDIRSEVAAIQAEKSKLQADHVAAVTAILTPEQRTAWATQKLVQDVTGRFGRVAPTDDQIAKARALAETAAKELVQSSSLDPKAYDQAREKLFKTIAEQILTDDQRAQLSGRPAAPAAKTPEAHKQPEVSK